MLKKWWKKKVKTWYYRYCDPDVVAMTRIQLMGVGKDLDFGKMTDEQRINFTSLCTQVVRNEAFQRVVDKIINEQKDFTVCRSQDARQGDFGRFTINGASLVREILEIYSSDQEPAEKYYDPSEVI
jgi:hypothetical protein